MSKFNDLLNLRFKQKETQQPKMTALVERSNNGDLSSFSGVFRMSALNEKEKLRHRNHPEKFSFQRQLRSRCRSQSADGDHF